MAAPRPRVIAVEIHKVFKLRTKSDQQTRRAVRAKETNATLDAKELAAIIGLVAYTEHDGINRCLGFIAMNFREPIRLVDLARVSGLSRRGFVKAFKRGVGANPGTVLRTIRLEYAKRLLINQDLTLRQIAKRSGYRSENTFCVAFQRATKTSPKKFQRQYWLAACRNQPHSGLKLHHEPYSRSPGNR